MGNSSNSNGFQWNEAAMEQEAKRNREIVRKADEDRLIEARRLEEVNRAAMVREHHEQEEQRKMKILEDERNLAVSLQQQREEER